MPYGRPLWLAAVEPGRHGCFFYTTTQELLEIALPVLKEGLKNFRERCLWILPSRLSKKEAFDQLSGYLKADLKPFLQKKQLIFSIREEWYEEEGFCSEGRLLQKGKSLWEETVRLEFKRLRILGQAPSKSSLHWAEYLKFESKLEKKLFGKPIFSLCGYSLKETPLKALSEVNNKHDFTFIRHAGEWHTISGSQYVMPLRMPGTLQRKTP